ncbi:hypothetical protein H7J06_04570 [Mycobacterium hodleri]|uniref:hypothetical protein n=1 Tax=Mycolicibacterium hodleri TaxID=49897 RepID=UPI0021F28ACD|nr:hypothetical protein [Mycolicibacterium hodleri]MCV7132249.1 hypothetical protein [Mycolicibacterium hodleri]
MSIVLRSQVGGSHRQPRVPNRVGTALGERASEGDPLNLPEQTVPLYLARHTEALVMRRIGLAFV